MMFKDLFKPARAAAEKPEAEARPTRTYTAGWIMEKQQASIIWDAPQPVRQDAPQTTAAKSVAFCPAVIEFDRRHFVINSPFDLHIKLNVGPKGELSMTNMLRERSPVRHGALADVLVMMNPEEWRHPQRPVVQMPTPFVFVSDDPLTLNQFPPFLHYGMAPLPGVQLCGRYPIDVWPRQLMWAFEWHDISKDFILKRGEPWFYVRFEGPDPSAQVRLIEGEKTPELMAFVESLTGVTNYVNRTFSLFETARERRPETLLVPRKR